MTPHRVKSIAVDTNTADNMSRNIRKCLRKPRWPNSPYRFETEHSSVLDDGDTSAMKKATCTHHETCQLKP